MNGPEHYRAAELCREKAAEAQNAAYDGTTPDGWQKAAYWNDAAQVHASLAQVAAIANHESGASSTSLAEIPGSWDKGARGDGLTWGEVLR